MERDEKLRVVQNGGMKEGGRKEGDVYTRVRGWWWCSFMRFPEGERFKHRLLCRR